MCLFTCSVYPSTMCSFDVRKCHSVIKIDASCSSEKIPETYVVSWSFSASNTKNTTTGLEKPKLYSFQGNKKGNSCVFMFLTVSRPFGKVGDRQGNVSLKRVTHL